MSKRMKTKYAGVQYINSTVPSTNKPEKIYYIRYRKGGKLVEERVGRQFQDDMSPARASGIRAERLEGKQISNNEARNLENNKWTIDKLFEIYKESRPDNKSRKTDEGRYTNYLQKPFGKKEPDEIMPLDVERLKREHLKKKSPQTVKHVLNLLTWIINYGTKNNICTGLSFHIKKPEVHNVITEDLTPEQLSNLLKVIETTEHVMGGHIMKLALYTGMRRGEMLKLEWDHINFIRNYITLKAPKGGIDQQIPLNSSAKELLLSLKSRSKFVFPGKKGNHRADIGKQLRSIKKDANLPKDFRTLHGLRHVFASMLASSGKVDMYTLQKLLTHKDPRMTQRYAHLRDETLQKASSLAGSIIDDAAKPKKDDKVKDKTQSA